jgi:hypothetical protein
MPENSALTRREALSHDFTTLAYQTRKSGNRAGFAPKGCTYMEKLSDRKRAVWKKGNHLEISFRGTNVFHLADLRSDFNLMLGLKGLDKRFRSEAKWFRKNVVDTNQSADIQGHSLGGSIAPHINEEFPNANIRSATTFDPAHGYIKKVVDSLTRTIDTDANYAKRTVHIIQDGDPVSTGSFSSLTGKRLPLQYGEQRIHRDLPEDASMVKRHKLDHFKRNGKWVGDRTDEYNKKHGIKRGWLEFIEELDRPDLSEIPNPKPRYTRRDNQTQHNESNEININPVFISIIIMKDPILIITDLILKNKMSKIRKKGKIRKTHKLPIIITAVKIVHIFKIAAAQMDLCMMRNLRNVCPFQKVVNYFKDKINNPGMHHFEVMRPVLAGMF